MKNEAYHDDYSELSHYQQFLEAFLSNARSGEYRGIENLENMFTYAIYPIGPRVLKP